MQKDRKIPLEVIKKISSSPSLWNIIYNCMRIGGNVLTLPMALKTLTANEMGLFYTFGAIGGLTAFLDMGLGGTAARQISYIHAGARALTSQGVPECHPGGGVDMNLFGQTVSTIRNIYRAMGFASFGLLIIPGSLFIHRNIISAGMSESYVFAWALYAISSSHSLGTGFWNNFLMGIKQQRLSGILGSLSQGIYVLLVILGLESGLGIWSYAIALLISGYAQRSASRHFFIKITDVPLGQKPDYSILKTLWPMSWRLATVLLCMYALQKACVMVSSRELGLQTTASYGLALSLFTIIFQIMRTPLYLKYPEIAQLRMQGKSSMVKKIFYPRLYFYLMAMAVMLGLIILIGPTCLRFMGSKTELPDTFILAIAAAFFILDRHQDEYLTLVLTENRNPFVLPYVFTAIISVIAMTIGSKKYGLIGLVAAQGFSTMMINNWWVVARGIKGIRISPKTTNQ